MFQISNSLIFEICVHNLDGLGLVCHCINVGHSEVIHNWFVVAFYFYPIKLGLKTSLMTRYLQAHLVAYACGVKELKNGSDRTDKYRSSPQRETQFLCSLLLVRNNNLTFTFLCITLRKFCQLLLSFLVILQITIYFVENCQLLYRCFVIVAS